ncbi:MAG: sortase-associated OmpA-like protein PdsO [Colwellia sp.]|nr:sortase-associated OmpA-like protein PdsO [Colwellia sp.]
MITLKKQNQANISAVKNISFKKAIMATAVITSLLSTPLMANTLQNTQQLTTAQQIKKEQHKHAELNQEIGLGTGLVVGAIVAGPIGAIVAALAGNFIAEHINANENIDALEVALTHEQLTYQQQLVSNQKMFEQKLQVSEQAFQTELIALEQNYQTNGQLQAENLLMSLQFSTGSTDIAPHYQEQIAVLADLLNRTPTMSVDLSGYTDLLGEEALNQKLSLARVQKVKNLLMAQGVEDERIITAAFGEAQPLVANAQQESSFYDRRVVMKLHNQVNQTAKNQ